MANQIGVKLGVLGAGGHSRYHHGPGLQIFAKRHPGRIHLAAVCDLDKEKAVEYARLFGFENTYTDLETMLDSEHLDGLLAVTPLSLTATIVERLLPHGIPLMVEKPPGQTFQQTKKLANLAAKYGTPHIVSFDRQFSPAINQTRQWLKEHANVPPHTILSVMRRVNRIESDFAVGTGIHLIDTSFSLMGIPTNYKTQNVKPPMARCPVFTASVNFEGGRTGLIEITPDAGTTEETYTLTGQGYTIITDTLHCNIRVIENDRESFLWTPPSTMTSAEKDGAVNEAEALVNLIETGQQPYYPTLADAVASMHFAEKMQQTPIIQ